MENKTYNKNGIGFCGLLTIAFIVLKLCGVINWSWIWVLAPLWIGWGLILIALVIACFVAFLRDRYF
jgi:Flp pilus assembly protein TadB